MLCYSLFPYSYTTRSWRNVKLTPYELRAREMVFAFRNRRDVRDKFKGPARQYRYLVDHMAWTLASIIHDSDQTLFVPVPSSMRTHPHPPERWPALDLASALNGIPLDARVHRIQAIDRSLPSPEQTSVHNDRSWHYQVPTLRAEAIPQHVPHICLVDDILGGGGTLLAAAHAVRSTGYKGTISGATCGYAAGEDVPTNSHSVVFRLDENSLPGFYRRFARFGIL